MAPWPSPWLRQCHQARLQGGGAGAGAHPWDGGTRAEGAGSLVSRHEEGTLVSLEWLFNAIQAKYGNKHLEKLQICVCVCQKSLIPIPYKVIIPLAPSPGRNTGSAPGHKITELKTITPFT